MGFLGADKPPQFLVPQACLTFKHQHKNDLESNGVDCHATGDGSNISDSNMVGNSTNSTAGSVEGREAHVVGDNTGTGTRIDSNGSIRPSETRNTGSNVSGMRNSISNRGASDDVIRRSNVTEASNRRTLPPTPVTPDSDADTLATANLTPDDTNSVLSYQESYHRQRRWSSPSVVDIQQEEHHKDIYKFRFYNMFVCVCICVCVCVGH